MTFCSPLSFAAEAPRQTISNCFCCDKTWLNFCFANNASDVPNISDERFWHHINVRVISSGLSRTVTDRPLKCSPHQLSALRSLTQLQCTQKLGKWVPVTMPLPTLGRRNGLWVPLTMAWRIVRWRNDQWVPVTMAWRIVRRRNDLWVPVTTVWPTLRRRNGLWVPLTMAWRIVRWRNGPQIRRVAANILNKQQRKPDKGWCSSLAVG